MCLVATEMCPRDGPRGRKGTAGSTTVTLWSYVARVLLVTDQWGYGTTTSAMSIADALKGLETRWLIGEGAGFTLASRDSLDECIPANTMAACPPEALKEAVRESSVVVSVMN